MDAADMDETQQIASLYIMDTSPVTYRRVRDYLRDEDVSEEDIMKVLIDEIIEKTFTSSRFSNMCSRPYTTFPEINYKTLAYNHNIVVLETEQLGILGLKESKPPGPGLEETPKRRDGILPSPDTVRKIIDREYVYFKTENELFDIISG
jgi:hypothetical protein